MINISVITKNAEKKTILFIRNVTKGIKKTLYKYNSLIVRRARLIHKYHNQTGTLTNNTKGTVRNSSIIIKNKTVYKPFVESHYSEDWILNSMNFYKYGMKKDLKNVPSKYYRFK